MRIFHLISITSVVILQYPSLSFPLFMDIYTSSVINFFHSSSLTPFTLCLLTYFVRSSLRFALTHLSYHTNPSLTMADELVEKMSQLLHLTKEESNGVEAPLEAWTTTNENFALFLVGRTLSKRPIHLESFKQLMSNSWRLMHGMEVRKINDDRLLFQFNHELDKKRVLVDGPWSFEKNLILLAPIEDGVDPMSVSLNSVSFHVLVSGISIGMMHRAMATVIGNGIGEFIDLPKGKDKTEEGMFLRIKVKIDISKPLKRALRVKCVNGESIMVTFTYERLPNFCY